MTDFRKKLEILFNCESMKNGSDTPDFILASYLVDCLTSFDEATRKREAWYGRGKVYSVEVRLDPTGSDPLKCPKCERFSMSGRNCIHESCGYYADSK
ncbi:hypothetical protein LCGC14_1874150 [marine sediment metagenome]|uniref:Uncharacterized protein n=1 Tax=marine sediment metagenome TaxID=412755 RepID=A0A0F9G429_9ZZZZ